MRILVANKFWYRRGGLERVMFDEVAWLTEAGHEVAHFSTAHPSNDASPWSRYFAPYLELGESGGLSIAGKAVAAARMFNNRDAARRFDALLADFRPDVVHVHGIHRQISPSVLDAARHRGVPVVQTLHDYHHVCPADVLLYAGSRVCDPRRCRKYWYGAAVRGRCVRSSLGASGLSAAETSWQRIRRAYERGIARFITPSRFLSRWMRDGGWELPIDLVPNAVPLQPPRESVGSGFAVVGRLAREKGVEIAIVAARQAGVRLTVAGEGPLDRQLREGSADVEFTGHLSGDEVLGLVKRSRAVVVPSLWFENAPMSVLEAMSAGVPVVGSAIGGIPELVSEGCGLLVEPGDATALAAAMRALEDDSDQAAAMGAAARERVRTSFSPEQHVGGLLGVYRSALGERSAGGEGR